MRYDDEVTQWLALKGIKYNPSKRDPSMKYHNGANETSEKAMLIIAAVCILGAIILPAFVGPATQDNYSSYNSVSGAE